MNLKEFITNELNGLNAQLSEAFTPPLRRTQKRPLIQED